MFFNSQSRHYYFSKLVLILCFSLALTGCGSSPVSNDDAVPQNITIDENTSIIANPTDLARYITLENEVIDIEEANVSSNSLSGNSGMLQSNAQSFSLSLKATVSSPVVSGNTLQATSVFLKGKYVYVSYNTRGEVFTGAVDVINISDSSNPQLKSRTIYKNKDINDVYLYSSRLMLAVAMDTGVPANNSKIESYNIKSNLIDFDDFDEQNVSSYAATSVYGNKNQRFITTGSTGSLYSFDRDLLAITSFEIEDARWVSGRGDDLVVLSGGSSPYLRFYRLGNESIQFRSAFPITEATEIEAKSVVEMSSDYAFVAGNKQGVSIYNIDSEQRVQNIPIPTSSDPNRDISTNSLTIYKDLMFISNGEAGVYVAQNSKQLTSVRQDRDMGLEVVGRLELGDDISANHVVYRKDFLIVAAGTGGVKLISVTNSKDKGDEDDDADDDDD